MLSTVPHQWKVLSSQVSAFPPTHFHVQIQNPKTPQPYPSKCPFHPCLPKRLLQNVRVKSLSLMRVGVKWNVVIKKIPGLRENRDRSSYETFSKTLYAPFPHNLLLRENFANLLNRLPSTPEFCQKPVNFDLYLKSQNPTKLILKNDGRCALSNRVFIISTYKCFSPTPNEVFTRSEERRVGKECRN